MNRRALFPAILSLLLITQSLFAASNEVPHKPFPPAWQATLDLFPAPVRPTGEGLVPGAVVIIKSPAFGVRVGVTGYADIPAKKPMSPDLHFRVGSVTKSFTAQIILMLEQQGKLKLTDLITKYLGDDPTVMAIPGIGLVTIGEALQMNSGIANYLGDPMISASPDVTPDRHYSPDELMAVLAVNRNPLQMLPPNPPPPPSPPVSCPPPPPSPPNPNPPMFSPPTATYPNPYWQTLTPSAPQPPPFASWFYSNSNYILLGMIIEKITGKPIQDVMKQEIFDPVGLRDTHFATDVSVPPNMIRGYMHLNASLSCWLYPKWTDVTNINPTYAWAAGAIISTPWDLLKYADTIFKTNDLLNAGTKEKWLTFVSAYVLWPGMEYGEGGVMQGQRPYGDLRGHGGAYPGYKTLLYYFPDSDTTIVLCTNTMDQPSEYQAPEVMILDSIMPLVKSAVTTPKPVDGGSVPVNSKDVQLAWQAGRVYGTSYDVYIGTDPEKIDRATSKSHVGVTLLTTTANSITYTAASPNKTYYWRVDTISAGQPLEITQTTPLSPFVAPIPPTVNGPVWSFRTGN